MSKNELIKAINISKPTKNNKKNIFKSKSKEIKDSLMKLSKEKILKWKIKEIKKILHDPRNNLFKPEKDHYNPTIIVMLLVIIISNIKVIEIKTNYYFLETILIWSEHVSVKW